MNRVLLLFLVLEILCVVAYFMDHSGDNVIPGVDHSPHFVDNFHAQPASDQHRT